jgi:hypothetical protein
MVIVAQTPRNQSLASSISYIKLRVPNESLVILVPGFSRRLFTSYSDVYHPLLFHPEYDTESTQNVFFALRRSAVVLWNHGTFHAEWDTGMPERV